MHLLVSLSFVIAAGPAPAEGTLFVSGFSSNSVVRYDATTGTVLGSLTGGGLSGPLGLAHGPDGLLYVASEGSDSILRFNPDTGDFVDIFIGPITGLTQPAGVVFGPDANDDGNEDLYVSSFDGDSILTFDGTSGALIGTFVTSGSGGLNGPDAGMTFGPDGDLYVPGFWSHSVLRYNGATGAFVATVVPPGQCGMNWPRTIVFEGDGDMLVSCEGTDRVSRYFGIGCNTLIPGIPEPTGVALDSAGFLYVASLSGDSVNRYVAATGQFDGVAVSSGAGGLNAPTFVLVIENAGGCVGDFDRSGTVDIGDLLTLLAAWGSCVNCPADLDDDDEVGTADLLILLGAWGQCA